MSLKVFGYNEETREIIGPLFQSAVEKPLHICLWGRQQICHPYIYN